jgi:hypothetical protein
MAKKLPKREWVLVDVIKKRIVTRAGKPILLMAAAPPVGERNAKYNNAGQSFAAVEIEYSTKHEGPPVYRWLDEQKAIVTKIIASTGE